MNAEMPNPVTVAIADLQDDLARGIVRTATLDPDDFGELSKLDIAEIRMFFAEDDYPPISAQTPEKESN